MAKWVVYLDEDPSGSSPTVVYVCDDLGIRDGNIISEIKYETDFKVTVGGVAQNSALDVNGNTIAYHSQQHPFAVAVDPVGHIYLASAPVSIDPPESTGFYIDYQLDYFRKYRSDGRRITDFPQLHGARIRCVAVDSSGNIYVGGDCYDLVNYYVARKYNSAGVLQFSMAGHARVPGSPYPEGATDHCYCIAVDSSGNVYTGGGNDYEFGVFKKYNSSGVLQWEKNPSGIVTGIVLDSSGYLYTTVETKTDAGLFDGGVTWDYFVNFDSNEILYNIIKWDSSGNFVSGIRVNSANSYSLEYSPRIAKGTGISELEITYIQPDDSREWDTYDLSLALVSSNTFSSKSLAVSADTTVYPNIEEVAPPPGDVTYPSLFWLGGGIAIAVADSIETQSLAIPFALAIPSTIGDRYTACPALSLGLSLYIPTTIREYVGSVFYPSVYRCYLAGTPTIELIIESIQLRMSTSAIWISVVVPAPTTTLIDAIEARDGNLLTIKKGFRFTDGTEQLEELVSAAFTGCRFDIGTNSASITLECQATPITNAKTRTLRGISTQGSINGRRYARSTVDTYLRPGDTALLGDDESLVVDEISIYVSPTTAIMDIREAE